MPNRLHVAPGTIAITVWTRRTFCAGFAPNGNCPALTHVNVTRFLDAAARGKSQRGEAGFTGRPGRAHYRDEDRGGNDLFRDPGSEGLYGRGHELVAAVVPPFKDKNKRFQLPVFDVEYVESM